MQILLVSEDTSRKEAWLALLDEVRMGLSSLVRSYGRIEDILGGTLPPSEALLVCESGADGEGVRESGLRRFRDRVRFSRVILSGPLSADVPEWVARSVAAGEVRYVCDEGAPSLARACRLRALKDAVAEIEAVADADAPSVPVYAAISQPLEEWGGMRSASPVMHHFYRYLSNVAPTDQNCALVGEPGTGKGFVARVIHANSRRRNGPFVSLNVGAIPDTMIESELFGYLRGAFTGALRDTPGKLALADKGTLVLDEIGELSELGQVKLLTFLTDYCFFPLGSRRQVVVDVRIIFCTNQDMDKLVEEGRLRPDFRSRICRNTILVPPLHERPEDIVDFCRHFLNLRCNGRYRLTEAARDKLVGARWEENLRELDNTLSQAANLVEHEADEHGKCTIDAHHVLIGRERPASTPACPARPAADGKGELSPSRQLYEEITASRRKGGCSPHYSELTKAYGLSVVLDVVALAMRKTGKANAAGAHLGFYDPGNRLAALAFTQWLRDNGTSASKIKRRFSNYHD